MLKVSLRAQRRLMLSFIVAWAFALCILTAQAAPHGKANTSSAHVSAAQTTPAQADATATIYGVKIHYVEAGSGPVLVLLHGLGGDSTNWAFNTSVLARKYR